MDSAAGFAAGCFSGSSRPGFPDLELKQEKKAMVKNAFRLTWRYCKIFWNLPQATVFAVLIAFFRVKIALNGGLKATFLQEVALQSRKPDNSGSCGWVYRNFGLSSLKKRRHIQFHHTNQAARVVWSTVIVEASIRGLIPEMDFLSWLVHIINEEQQITVWLFRIGISDQTMVDWLHSSNVNGLNVAGIEAIL